jgi:hypothetical protein
MRRPWHEVLRAPLAMMPIPSGEAPAADRGVAGTAVAVSVAVA